MNAPRFTLRELGVCLNGLTALDLREFCKLVEHERGTSPVQPTDMIEVIGFLLTEEAQPPGEAAEQPKPEEPRKTIAFGLPRAARPLPDEAALAAIDRELNRDKPHDGAA